LARSALVYRASRWDPVPARCELFGGRKHRLSVLFFMPDAPTPRAPPHVIGSRHNLAASHTLRSAAPGRANYAVIRARKDFRAFRRSSTGDELRYFHSMARRTTAAMADLWC